MRNRPRSTARAWGQYRHSLPIWWVATHTRSFAEFGQCSPEKMLEGEKRMGKFDKRAYDIAYIKEHTRPYNWRLSNDDRDKLDQYAAMRGMKLSAVLKNAIDADAIAHGLPPVFSDNSAAEPETGRK